MSQVICYYRIDGHSQEHQRHVFTSASAMVPQEAEDLDDIVAEWCAQDYWDHHDGWESSWPLTVVLYLTEDGPECARYEVEVEHVPQFSASEVAT